MATKRILPTSLKRSRQILLKQQCRCLSSTSRLPYPQGAGEAGTAAIRSAVQRSLSGQMSMQGQMAKVKKSSMPTDLGLLPDTLVRPNSEALPSLLSGQWRRRLKIEWMALTQKTKQFLGLVVQCKWNVPVDPLTGKWMQRPLMLRERASKARELHAELYTAIARRNRSKIEDIACTGLKRQLKVRLDHRELSRLPREKWSVTYRGWTPGPKVWWIFEALCPPQFKSTQILVDSEAQIPLGEHATLRQVIVKIKTKQTLDKNDGEPPKTIWKDEYVVIQKMRSEGLTDNWMIWGTTQPTTDEQIDKLIEAAAQQEKFRDKFDQQLAKWSDSTKGMP